MPSQQPLISRIASHGLTGVGIALIAGAALVAQVQAEAAATGEPSPTSQAVITTAASVRGALQGPALSIRQISERMEGLGYRDLREIEWDDGLYKIKGQSAEGRFVKLYVDGHSGQVLSVRARH
jgi:hypothetical protein